MDDVFKEYDHVVLELVERSAARRGHLQRYLAYCLPPKVTSLNLDSIKDSQVKGLANRCGDRADSSWKMFGWVLVGKPARKAEKILVVDQETGTLIPTSTTWMQRADIHGKVSFGPARFDDVGFQTDVRYLPEIFDVLALADGQLYRVPVRKRCRDEDR
jgi:hypothetical protein